MKKFGFAQWFGNVTVWFCKVKLMFWDEKFFELRSEAKSQFELLKKAKIFFTDPVKAANHLKLYWNDYEGWWYKSETQKARKIFCSYYAKYNKDLVTDIRDNIKEFLN